MSGLFALRPLQERAMDERWVAVVGWEGLYEVSDLGRVRSLDRVIEQKSRWGGTERRRWKGRILKPTPSKWKYSYGRLEVKLCGGAHDEQRTRLVHQLVLEAFVGPRPPGRESAHGDGNSQNNVLTNLRYDTPKGNNNDKRLHGTFLRGEQAPSAKITEEQARAVRAFKGTLENAKAIFGISTAQVSRIRNGRQWQHLGEG